MNYIIDPVNNTVFDDADPSKRRTIVLLGINTYQNIPRRELLVVPNHDETVVLRDDTIKTLQQELTSLRNTQASRISDEVNKQCTLMDNLHKDEIRRLSSCLEREINNHQLEIQRFQKMRETGMDQMYQRHDALFEKILNTMEEKNAVKTSHAIGKEGEKCVKTYLEDHFGECEVEDVAGHKHHGDIIFTYRGVRILIEVKNKTKVSSEDVIKFKDDVIRNSVRGGIIISTRDGVKFACKTPGFAMEYTENNTPLMYVTEFNTNPMGLQSAALMMYHLIKSEDRDKDAEYHARKYIELLTYINEVKPLIDTATKGIKSAWTTMKSVQDLFQEKMKEFSQNPDITPTMHANTVKAKSGAKSNKIHEDIVLEWLKYFNSLFSAIHSQSFTPSQLGSSYREYCKSRDKQTWDLENNIKFGICLTRILKRMQFLDNGIRKEKINNEDGRMTTYYHFNHDMVSAWFGK